MHQILLLVCLPFLLCAQYVRGQASPVTSSKVYATKGEQVQLLCQVGDSNQRALWKISPSASTELRRKINNYYDPDDASKFFLVIEDAQPSDAGNFECVTGFGKSTVQLIVIEPSEPRVVRVKSVDDRGITVSWAAPFGSVDEVRGYTIYATEIGEEERTLKFEKSGTSDNKKETFRIDLENRSVDGKYELKISAVYPHGPAESVEDVEGPMSSEVEATLPALSPDAFKATNVEAKLGEYSSVVVSWTLSLRAKQPASLLGYRVLYKNKGKRKAPIKGEVIVNSPIDDDGRWQAELNNLKTRVRYEITVQPILTSGNGPSSDPLVYKHEGFEQSLSVQAVALSSDSVVVSYYQTAPGRIFQRSMFYAREGAVGWTRVKNFNAKENFGVVSGLEPQTTYFFQGRGKHGSSDLTATTHLVTPPSDVPIPTGVTVTPRDGNVKVTWLYDEPMNVKGFVVTVEEKDEDGAFKVVQEVTRARDKMFVTIRGLAQERQYRFKVAPFDLGGPREASEPVLFPEEDVKQDAITHSLALKVLDRTQSKLHMGWRVDQGDVALLVNFHVTFSSESGQKILDKLLDGSQRSITVSALEPSTTYVVTVQALDSAGAALAEEDLAATTHSLDHEPTPHLYLEASEIHATQATILWSVWGVEDSSITGFRMNIQLDGPNGLPILRRDVAPGTRTFGLRGMVANRRFYVVLDAIGTDNLPFLRSALTIDTPASGSLINPVVGSPLEVPLAPPPPPETEAPPPLPETEAPPPPPETEAPPPPPETEAPPPPPDTEVPPPPRDNEAPPPPRDNEASPPPPDTEAPPSSPDTEAPPPFPDTTAPTAGTEPTTVVVTTTQEETSPTTTEAATTEAADTTQAPTTETTPAPTTEPVTVKPPELQMFLTKQKQGIVNVRWTLLNAPPGSVTGYKLTLKKRWPKGNVLLEQELSLQAGEIDLDVRPRGRNKRYIIIVEAMAPDGSALVKVQHIYNYARSNRKIVKSSKDVPRRRSR